MTAAPTGRGEDLELRAAVVLEALGRGLLADRVVDFLIERARGAAGCLDLLLDERVAIIKQKVEATGGAAGSLDQKIYDAVREQAATKGLEYDGGPKF